MKKPGKQPAAPAKDDEPAVASEPHIALPKGGAGGLLGGRLGSRYMIAAAAYPPDVKGPEGIGKRMLWGRERLQLSSRAIASDIDLSPEAITFYERDGSKRSIAVDKADKISAMLGLRFEWFCLGNGEPFIDMAASMEAIRATRTQLGLPPEMEGSPGVDLQLIKMKMGTGNMEAPTVQKRKAAAASKAAKGATKKRKPS